MTGISPVSSISSSYSGSSSSSVGFARLVLVFERGLVFLELVGLSFGLGLGLGLVRSLGLGGVVVHLEVVDVTELVDLVVRSVVLVLDVGRPVVLESSSSRSRESRRSRRMAITTWSASSSSRMAMTITNHLA